MSLRTHSDTQIRENINFIFVIFVGLFWTPGNNLCYVYHTLFQISSRLLSEFILSHLCKSKNLSWIVFGVQISPAFYFARLFWTKSKYPIFMEMNNVRWHFCWQNCEKVKVIRDYAKSISYFTMDNECHANIVFLFKIAPTPLYNVHFTMYTTGSTSIKKMLLKCDNEKKINCRNFPYL